MKVGDLVKAPDAYGGLIGLVLVLGPFDDLKYTEIYWVDEDIPSGTIISVWENTDFEVINEEI